MKWVDWVRTEADDQGTFGVLTIGNLMLSTGELPWRNNKISFSCIPEGIYTAKLLYSKHFKRLLYVLRHVPGRREIEIHPANFFGDTTLGYQADSEGCVGVGKGVGIIANHEMNQQKGLLQSRQAFREFMDECSGDELTITITSKINV